MDTIVKVITTREDYDVRDSAENALTIEEVIEYEKDDSYEKGHSDGMSAGISTGISTGINGCIRACRKFGKSDAEIIEVLIEEYALSHEEAEQKVNNL